MKRKYKSKKYSKYKNIKTREISDSIGMFILNNNRNILISRDSNKSLIATFNDPNNTPVTYDREEILDISKTIKLEQGDKKHKSCKKKVSYYTKILTIMKFYKIMLRQNEKNNNNSNTV